MNVNQEALNLGQTVLTSGAHVPRNLELPVPLQARLGDCPVGLDSGQQSGARQPVGHPV